MKPKCSATGKSIFASQREARNKMFALMLPHFSGNGKRVKHRQGKPALRQVYPCSFCGGYHLSSKRYYPKEVRHSEDFLYQLSKMNGQIDFERSTKSGNPF